VAGSLGQSAQDRQVAAEARDSTPKGPWVSTCQFFASS
jgi:hypothetical protein